MSKVAIIYWSGTGNTEAMAGFIREGAEEAGAQVTLMPVSEANPQSVSDYDVLVLGCPSMGAEVLEESEFEPFIEAIEGLVQGKSMALFGSYGWGDGEWMRNWAERMKAAGAQLLDDGLTINDAPDDAGAQLCRSLGKAAADM